MVQFARFALPRALAAPGDALLLVLEEVEVWIAVVHLLVLVVAVAAEVARDVVLQRRYQLDVRQAVANERPAVGRLKRLSLLLERLGLIQVGTGATEDLTILHFVRPVQDFIQLSILLLLVIVGPLFDGDVMPTVDVFPILFIVQSRADTSIGIPVDALEVF